MHARKNVILLSFFLLLCLPDSSDSVDPCIHDVNLKGVIDLTSVGHMDGTPAWKNAVPDMSDKHDKPGPDPNPKSGLSGG
ncbi:unnamed protein product, partial [Rotaria sp. Silwood1]